MKTKVAAFSSIVGCGIIDARTEHFIVAIVPPRLPEKLYEEVQGMDVISLKRKYYKEIKKETERVADIICKALNDNLTS